MNLHVHVCAYTHMHTHVKQNNSKVWYFPPVTPALGKLEQEDHKFKTSLQYVVRPSFKIPRATNVEQWENICLAFTKPWVQSLIPY